MNTEPGFLRRAWLHDKALDSLKVALAFAGVLVFYFVTDLEQWLVGLLLGVIACALAETPDRFVGRLQALLVTLACFAIAAFSVRLLFPHPWLFVLGLGISTLGFVMLGALGERYATISVAAIILAVYTMLGLSQHGSFPTQFWQDPLVLLAGASWYGCISLLASAIFGLRPARQVIAQVFDSLAIYLELKADLLEPIAGRDINTQRLALAAQNGRLVGLMNRAREILLLWAQGKHPARGSQSLLHWYFLAQEIHERTSSAHYPYDALAKAFARSDILFRCQHLMRAQAECCKRLAEAILSSSPYAGSQYENAARQELGLALTYLQTQNAPCDTGLLDSLADLCRNISTIGTLLAKAAMSSNIDIVQDNTLRDYNPKTLAEIWQRLREQVSPPSKRFRHGVRLAVALAAGYGLLHAFSLPQGYWVILTTVFVCQPNFSTTWQRLGQRIGGTLLGLCAASLFISAFPHHLAQLALLLVSGVAFFVFRANRYMLATACITVLVMICFNQFGSSYALILPRLVDTLIGSALAAAAAAFILPDWQGKHIHHAMARSIKLADIYLGEVLCQYREGKRDDLPYRVARRDAHNADAELSTTLSTMLAEPGRYRMAPEATLRFLHAGHSLLGYISALGAHRERIENWQQDAQITATERHIRASLQGIANALDSHACTQITDFEPIPEARSAQASANPVERRLMRQLRVIEQLLPELAELASAFAREATPKHQD
ncbi:YccS family putative transporter [Uliginosibacterium gangwonense]|uniref:YccS family putative transporter n=1 Tax=Uliginosibacterium gangwonense TaxID=392736 RepID=UPI00037B6142|nr:YccS family putative transporter [Uliginosibacterium gangwonense]